MKRISSPAKLALFTGALLAIADFSGCAGGRGEVDLQSAGFATTGPATLERSALTAASPLLPLFDPAGGNLNPSATADVNEFKFCVSRVKLEDDGGEIRSSDDNEQDIRFTPGLIDVSSGKENLWGTMEIPTGFRLRTMKIKVHRDVALCGAPYSILFNGQSTNQDVEFKFRFNPAVDIDVGDTIRVSLETVVAALRTAAGSGSLTGENIKSIVESIESEAAED